MLGGGALGTPGDIVDVAEGMSHDGLGVGSLIIPIAEGITEHPADQSGMSQEVSKDEEEQSNDIDPSND